MDWRNRDYYLVTTDYTSYDMRMNFYRIAAESLKVHQPYNHLPHNLYKQDGKFNKYDYDGEHVATTGMNYVQAMMSCKKEDSESLEYEFRKGQRNDGYGTRFFKLTKEICGQ